MNNKLISIFIVLVALASTALAVPKHVALSQCLDTEFEVCVVLPEGASGYSNNIVVKPSVVNYQSQVVRNGGDVLAYVDANVVGRELTVFDKNVFGRGHKVIISFDDLTDKTAAQVSDDISKIQSVCKKYEAACRMPPKDEKVEMTIPSEGPKARTIFEPDNKAGDWLFGFNPDRSLFGNPVTIGMGKNQARTCFVDENNKIKC